MAKPQISIPLDIDDVNVLKGEVSQNGDLHINLESSLNYGCCRRCGQKLTKLHGYDAWVKVQHLPILGHAVFLHYRPKRYACPNCDGKPTTTQQLAWHEPNSPHTKAYDEYLLRCLVNSTVQDVSTKERLSYDRVLGVLERCIARKVDWTRCQRLNVVGLDEIARLKGHGDFVTIVSARLPDGQLAILGVLADRQKETVKAFLQSIPPVLRATIRTVCSDLYEGYLQAVHEVLPKARQVIDRFHVAKLYRAAADAVRKTELKRLRKTLAKADYQQLKGSLWTFRKNEADLEPKERAILNRLFTHSPVLEQAYSLREQLTAIFEQPPFKNDAKRALRAWEAQVVDSGLTCFDSFRKTLHRHWEAITNYFVDLQTSGFVEGFNNKLKVLKRRCYGITNLDHLFQRLFLDLEGYRLFACD
jgi:transposase